MGDVLLIPAEKIRPSAWANRHEHSFSMLSYLELRENIRVAGANVQPIKVRPIPSTNGQEYEIVYGHRRHHACLELGLPVTSIVDDVTDQQLFAEMDRENRNRADLSPWEQGMHYQRAIDTGIYPSMRKLAHALDVSHSLISTSIKLAALPKEVIEAFGNPLHLQHRWASALMDAHNLDRAGLISRAKKIKYSTSRWSAKEVFDYLVSGQAKEDEVELKRGNYVVGKLSRGKNGSTTIRLRPRALSRDEEGKLIDFLANLT